MVLPSINRFQLITYKTFDVKTSKFNKINNTNNQSYKRLRCTSNGYISILIIDVISTMYSNNTFVDHLYISSYNVSTNMIVLIRYSIVMYYQWTIHVRDETEETIGDMDIHMVVKWIYFVFGVDCFIIYVIIRSSASNDMTHYDSLRSNYYTLYINDLIIESHYFNVESIFVSIRIGSSSIFINCIVIEFNNRDYISYYEFIDCYAVLLGYSIMIYSSFISFKLIIYDMFRFYKQYFNDLNNTFDENKSNIDQTYQSVGHLLGASITCILMRIMSFFCTIYCVELLISYLSLPEMILLYHFIQIIIVLIEYLIMLCHYYNQTMHFILSLHTVWFLSLLDLCMVFHWWLSIGVSFICESCCCT